MSGRQLQWNAELPRVSRENLKGDHFICRAFLLQGRLRAFKPENQAQINNGRKENRNASKCLLVAFTLSNAERAVSPNSSDRLKLTNIIKRTNIRLNAATR